MNLLPVAGHQSFKEASTVVVQITLIKLFFFPVTLLLFRILTKWENQAFVRNKWLFCFLSFVCVF